MYRTHNGQISAATVYRSILPVRTFGKQCAAFRFISLVVMFFVIHLPGISFSSDLNLTKDATGWTVFTPSADTRIMYVSSNGDDSTGQVYSSASPEVGSDPFNPTSKIQPFATYTAAYKHAREGYPDWILFKRGESFIISSMYAIIPTSGRSATEPSLTGAYGGSGASPLIKVTERVEQAIRIHRSSPNWIAISGIDFYSFTRNPNDAGYVGTAGNQTGLYVYSGATSLSVYNGFLIEGCKFRFFDDSMVASLNFPVQGLTIRRTLFADAYAGGGQSHCQGLLLTNQNATLDENIFVHNGWLNPVGSGVGEATVFNHNVYNSSPDGAVYKGNIFIQGSNMNNKFAADSYLLKGKSNSYPISIQNNLYIDGQQGIGFGNNSIGNTYPFANVTIKDNIFTNIGYSAHLQRIAWGIDVSYDTVGVLISDNIMMNQNSDNVNNINAPFMMAGIHTGVQIQGNVVSNWKFADALWVRDVGTQNSTGSTKTNVSFAGNTILIQENAGYFVKADTTLDGLSFSGNKYYSDKASNAQFRIGSTEYSLLGWQGITGDNSTVQRANFPDPTRSVEKYMQMMGEKATIDAFISKCRAQDRYNWDVRFTADKVNSWIKAGFNAILVGPRIPADFQRVQ